jgi:hypothetical protein
VATDKQLQWQRGKDGFASNSKQKSTNSQPWASNNGMMRWRVTAAKDMRQMEKLQGRGNRQATMVGGGVATTALMATTTKQQSTNVRGQRRRTAAASKRQGTVVEAEEQLLCGSKEEKALHNNEMEHGGGRWTGMCSFFCFLAGLNPTLNPTLANPAQNLGNFFIFWGGGGLGRIGGRIRIGVILWSFLVNLS